jgi:phenylalanyl-tRNA synthetase alpha chain
LYKVATKSMAHKSQSLSLRDQLLELEKKALQELEAVKDPQGLEQFRIAYLGKKGHITAVMKRLGGIPAEERPKVGELANRIKQVLAERFQEGKDRISSEKRREKPFLDLTLPGREPARGHVHPITQVSKEICEIFVKMGFRVVEGPDVELDYYNFEALNIPKDHPARDMQDTFYVSQNVVLRTHTSPMEIRVMESQPPPVSIIAPGKVYRRDSDVTHTPMFHQVEGLLVDKGISFGDLKGTLSHFVHQMFGSATGMRFRPSFFPFTEPSAELDIQCVLCGGEGCRTCSNTGWLEILGCGMNDPAIYGFVDYDPEVYSGFAFGMGIERVAMLKYGIDDIHLFYRNDMRVLRQF